MYSLSDLTKYDYFKNVDIKYALDSLTGVVSRGYVLGFAKNLVKKKTPFMMAIMDIDNFKTVNDNYGHKFGDECLKEIGKSLIEVVGKNGIVGRYGGDEFIILYFGDTSYKNVHSFVSNIYAGGTVVRRRLKFNDIDLYVTATTGCSSFPKDAKNYDDLFLTVDKTLYRGKKKGRNCFIVYVEEKHKNIDVRKKDNSLLSLIFKNLYNIVYDEQRPPIEKIIENLLTYLANTLQLPKVIMVNNDLSQIITSANIKSFSIDDDIFNIFKSFVQDEEVFLAGDINQVKLLSTNLKKYIEDNNIQTFAISKIQSYKTLYGYIILIEDKIDRVWQDNNTILLMYIDRLIYELYEERMKEN